MKRLIGTVLFALAGGCATYQPVPPGYTGPAATVADFFHAEDRTKAQIFAMLEVDGNPIDNSIARSGSGMGMGMGVSIKIVERQVPARPMKVKLRATEVPGTRDMREISIGLRTSRGLVLVAGCSHPGIEKILEASRPLADKLLCIFGGLHLVLTKEPEIRRVIGALRNEWHVEHIAPGHCTGEPAFAAIREIFGERCLFAGLGESIEL